MTYYVFGSGVSGPNGPQLSGSGITLNNGDSVSIRDGGTVTDTIVNSGGVQSVDGGLAASGLINNGGSEQVNAGSSVEVVVLSGGSIYVFGGTTSGTVISFGGSETVDSGGTASGDVVVDGGIEDVLGGAASGAVVLDGGLVNAQYSGTTSGTQVSAGGTELVEVTGAATGTVVSSGGTQVVLSLGGTETAFENGQIAAITVVRGGDTISFTSNGQLAQTILSSGGQVYVTEYTSTGTAVYSGVILADLALFAAGVASGTTVQSGGTILLAGGTVSGLTVEPGGRIVVGGLFNAGLDSGTPALAQETGIVISGIAVTAGALESVSSGGQTLGTVVGFGGTETVLSGGIVSSTVTSAGGSSVISSGAVTSSAYVLGGTMLFLGGTLSGASAGNGGTISVVSGSASGTQVLAGGAQIVLSGATATATSVASGGAEILSGGAASQTTVYSGGTQTISSGGTAAGTVVSSGGTQIVSAFGSAVGAMVAGTETLSGGTAAGTVVSLGGTLSVSAGGVARAATILGLATVAAGGSAAGGTIGLGGQASIANGGAATGLTVVAGATEIVSAGGMDTAANVAGVQILSAGSAVSATVLAGGVQTVSSGGMSVSATLEGGSQTLSSGGMATATQVDAGGTQTVLTGGTDSAGVISGGAQVVQSGTASGATVLAGGTQTLSAGGTASGGQILSGGTEVVLAGATASGVGVTSGQQTISAGGSATMATIQDGGTETVLGSATLTTLSTMGGAITTVAGIDFLGGLQVVSNGGQVTSTRVMRGLEQVLAGGRSISATISGFEAVYAGGVDVGATVSDTTGGLAIQYVSGGTASSANLGVNGRQQVYAGGAASGTIVGSGGAAIISAGGTATGVTVQLGGEELLYGGTDTGAVVSGHQVVSGSSLNATIVGDGSDPLATAVITFSAYQRVGSNGIARGTRLSANADQNVQSGGVASGTVVNRFTYEFADDGGTIVDSVVSSGGVSEALSGGRLSNTTVNSGASEIVLSGGLAVNTTISGGRLALEDPSGAGGAITFAGSGGILYLTANVTPTNVISGFNSDDQIELFGLTYNSADTVTVSGDIVTVSAGGATYSLDIAGASQTFSLAPSTGTDNTGKLVLSEAPCYLAGTRILTERGEAEVETLTIGDRVMTLSGALRPIRWIGVRQYDNQFVRDDPNIMPIRVAAGALGNYLPKRSLLVSPEHALFLDGVLVPAKLLINGASVVQVFGLQTIDYYHVELDSHDILLAEGAPAESFVDCDSRAMFHNAKEFDEFYPDAVAPRWAFCAPRVEDGDKLAAIQLRLARLAMPERANAPGKHPVTYGGHLDAASHDRYVGWAWTPDDPAVCLEVELLADGGVIGRVTANRMRTDVKAAGLGHGRYGFEFTPPRPLPCFEPHRLSARVVGGPNLGMYHLPAAARLSPESLGEISTALHAKALSDDGSHEVAGFLQEQLRGVRGPARRRAAAPLALVLDDELPTPDRDAGSNAIVSHMRSLVRLGYDVVFAPLAQPDLRRAVMPEVAGVRWASGPEYSSVEDVLRQHADAALVYVHRVTGMTLYGRLVRRACPNARLLYSVADLHFLRVGRQAALEGRPAGLQESQRLREEELAAVRLADITITHSHHEMKLLRAQLPRAAVRVVPWEVPCRAVQRPFAERRGAVFVGGMSHLPNLDAVRWLAGEIMPRVTAIDPAISCALVGAGLTPADRRALPDSMTALGHVPDLAPVYGAARLTVAPLRFGAGVKGKVVESLGAGLPCVMSPIAAEGLPLTDLLVELIAADPDSFASRIVRMHSEESANDAMARAGIDFVSRHLSAACVDDALAAAAASSRAPVVNRRAGRVRG